jgi:hypothetical protein
MSRKKGQPLVKNGHCEECLQFRELTVFRNKYICRDCFVGDYDQEYVENRLQNLLRSTSALSDLINGDQIGEGHIRRTRKRKGKG